MTTPDKYDPMKHALELLAKEGRCNQGPCSKNCFIKKHFKYTAGCTTSGAKRFAERYLADSGCYGVCESVW